MVKGNQNRRHGMIQYNLGYSGLTKLFINGVIEGSVGRNIHWIQCNVRASSHVGREKIMLKP